MANNEFLNNNHIVDLLRNAYAQSTGKETYTNFYDIIGTGTEENPQYPKGSEVPISTLDLQDFIDTGNDDSIIGSKEQFTKALINMIIKRWYTDEEYRGGFDSPFFYDSEKMGAIISMVSVEVPDVQENTAWKDMKTGDKIGCYELNIPVVEEQFFGKSTSWKLPLTINGGTQWNSAFRSESDLREFVNYIFIAVSSKLAQHHEDMDNMNRNNFIAEKLNAQATAGGVQEYDVVRNYCVENCINSMTRDEFLNNGKALRWSASKINEYMNYLTKQSTLFNTARKTKFTPKNRLVAQVLNAYKTAFDREVMSDTFNTQFADLKGNYQVVPYWQTMDTDSEDVASGVAFDKVSSIDIKTASNGTVSQHSNIIALLVDKWAICHTLISERVASQYFTFEDVYLYEYQFCDRRLNNLTLNGIVFTANDYTAE